MRDRENHGWLHSLLEFLVTETFEYHSHMPKKAYKCSIRVFASFPFVWQLRLSLHRESTNSLIQVNLHKEMESVVDVLKAFLIVVIA